MQAEGSEGVVEHRARGFARVALPLELRVERPPDLRAEVFDSRELEVAVPDDATLRRAVEQFERDLDRVAVLREPAHARPLGELLRDRLA
jgi:hypothetical protein